MYAGPLYSQFAVIDYKKHQKQLIERGEARVTAGTSPADAVGKLADSVEWLETASRVRQRWIQRAFDVHLWALRLGMALLMVSRGLDPATKLIARIAG